MQTITTSCLNVIYLYTCNNELSISIIIIMNLKYCPKYVEKVHETAIVSDA